jgi:hypothetical protein
MFIIADLFFSVNENRSRSFARLRQFDERIIPFSAVPAPKVPH